VKKTAKKKSFSASDINKEFEFWTAPASRKDVAMLLAEVIDYFDASGEKKPPTMRGSAIAAYLSVSAWGVPK
jgi:hypothetical protein